MSEAQTIKFISALKKLQPTEFLGAVRLLGIPIFEETEEGSMRPVTQLILESIAKFDTLPKRVQKQINEYVEAAVRGH